MIERSSRVITCEKKINAVGIASNSGPWIFFISLHVPIAVGMSICKHTLQSIHEYLSNSKYHSMPWALNFQGDYRYNVILYYIYIVPDVLMSVHLCKSVWSRKEYSFFNVAAYKDSLIDDNNNIATPKYYWLSYGPWFLTNHKVCCSWSFGTCFIYYITPSTHLLRFPKLN